MLPLKNRLKKEKEIERVFRKGEGVKGKYFFLKKVENNLKETRFCISVPTDISGKAVVRNKIKRRLREIIRKAIPEIEKGMDVVVVALKGVENLGFWEIREELMGLFKKAKILK